MPWTLFWDMHSGGGCKEDLYEKIYIEAPEEEAKVIFYNRFGHNPSRVSCTCCGEDYSISESPSLEQASAFHRGCKWVSVLDEPGGGHYVDEPEHKPWRLDKYQTLDEYVKNSNVLVIYAKDIKTKEREGSVPEQGYVWID